MRSILLRHRALAVLLLLFAAFATSAWAIPPALLAKAVKPAAVAAPTVDDATLAARLNGRLDKVEGLSDVRATVTAGVVRLGGEALNATHVAKAEQIASAEPGVTRVENSIAVDATVQDRLDGAMDLALDKLTAMLGALPLFLIAVLLVLLANWLGRTLGRRIQLKRLNHGNNPYFDALVRRATHAVVLIIGVLIALELMDWTGAFGAVVGSAGVVGLIIGFGFRDIAENYIAGILLSMRRPFKPGDHIVIEKFEGKVVALTSRSTVLMTMDGNRLSLPNALVFKSVLLNYSDNPKRRFEFDVTIDPDESIGTSQSLGIEKITALEGVLADPAPSSLVTAYAPTGSVLRFFGWVDQTQNDLGKVRTEALRAVKGAFAEAGIELPRSVHYIVQQSAAAQQRAHATASPQQEEAGDTSVNHDIDTQMANAQDRHSGDNLL